VGLWLCARRVLEVWRGSAHGEHASKAPGAYVEMTRRDDGFFVHMHTCEMSPILYPYNRDILT
jgi:hypothetical protein